MLEKNSNFLYFDAHFHLFHCKNDDSYSENPQIYGCSCAHSQNEMEMQLQYPKFVQSYGLHPQSAGFINYQADLDFLEKQIISKNISVIGEIGFDFYTDEYSSHAKLQEELFNNQIDLALKYNLPVVIHCRKANEKLFEYSKQLKNLSGVLFHSFMGPEKEAESLIKKDINCWFSFGKQIFNGNKKVIQCVKNLPLENLLMETDAPFQTLKNENKTFTDEIIKIYEGAYKLKYDDENKKSYENFCHQLEQNFHSLFNLPEKIITN